VAAGKFISVEVEVTFPPTMERIPFSNRVDTTVRRWYDDGAPACSVFCSSKLQNTEYRIQVEDV